MEKKEILYYIILPAAAAAAVVIAVAAALMLRVRAESYRSIRVVELEGDVSIDREGVGDLEASANMNLISGDRISTSADAYVVLRLDEDKYVMLGEEGAIQVLASGNASDSRTEIHLETGTIVNNIQNPLSQDSSYEIVTPSATMSVRGTVFEVRWYPDSKVGELLTYEGSVALTLEGKEPVLYGHGEYTQFQGGDTPQFLVEREAITDKRMNLQMVPFLYRINEYERELDFGEGNFEELVEQAKEEGLLKTEEPAKTPAPAVTPTSSPTPTVTPTSSPKSTVTPTSSPKPTVTPKPSPKPTVTPTASPKSTETPASASGNTQENTPADSSSDDNQGDEQGGSQDDEQGGRDDETDGSQDDDQNDETIVTNVQITEVIGSAGIYRSGKDGEILMLSASVGMYLYDGDQINVNDYVKLEVDGNKEVILGGYNGFTGGGGEYRVTINDNETKIRVCSGSMLTDIQGTSGGSSFSAVFEEIGQTVSAENTAIFELVARPSASNSNSSSSANSSSNSNILSNKYMVLVYSGSVTAFGTEIPTGAYLGTSTAGAILEDEMESMRYISRMHWYLVENYKGKVYFTNDDWEKLEEILALWN